MSDQTNETLCALLRQGERNTLEDLVRHNLPFIRQEANRIAAQRNCHQMLDDLIQEGTLGLIHAAELYDPETKTKFLTYAGYWVRNYILKYIDTEDQSENISLEEIGQNENRATWLTFDHFYALSPEEILLHAETMRELHQGLASLNQRESTYLRYRFGFPDEPENRTRKETAKHFTLSESRAKSIEDQALNNLRSTLGWWDVSQRCGGTGA